MSKLEQMILRVVVLGLVITVCYLWVERNNVTQHSKDLVSPSGNVLMRFASPLPDPVLAGEEYARFREVHGIQLLAENGNEIGGFVVNPTDSVQALCFDYTDQDVIAEQSISEAMCFAKLKKDLKIVLFDTMPVGKPVGSQVPERVVMGLESESGRSYFSLGDGAGNTRLKLSVTKSGEAQIQFFDEHGQETSRLPR